MQTTAALKRPAYKRGIDNYQRNSILNASPTELILKLYDLALVSLERRDADKVNQVLAELIASLNFDYQEQAVGLFRLYQYCQDCIYGGDFDQPKEILKGLRETWAEAFNL